MAVTATQRIVVQTTRQEKKQLQQKQKGWVSLFLS